VLDQSARDRELDGVSLTVHAATARNGFDVELVLKVRDLKGLEELALQSEGGEDVLEGVVVDGDFTCSGRGQSLSYDVRWQ